MKKLFTYMMAALLAIPAFWGCDDAANPVLPNSIYFQEAVQRDEFNTLIKGMKSTEAMYNITIKMTHKLDHDVKMTVVVDHDLMARHYEKFGEEIAVIPTDNWILYDTDGTPHAGESMELTFPANQTVAVLPVKILPIEGADESQYALPLTIKSVSEDIHVLENLRSQLMVFQAPFETPVMFMAQNSQTPIVFAESAGSVSEIMTHNWTLEFHYHINRNATNNLYGCPMLFMGPSEIYVRQYPVAGGMDIHVLGTFGPGSYNITKRGYPSDYFTNMAYQGQWNHFALVCENGNVTSYLDGQMMTVTSSPQFDTDYLFRSLSIYSTENAAQIGYSEIRFWSVARTPTQLSRFKYSVDPNTKGLEVYYRCNEPNDNVLKDSSHNGFDWDISDRSNKNKNQITWGRARTNDDFTSFVTVE